MLVHQNQREVRSKKGRKKALKRDYSKNWARKD